MSEFNKSKYFKNYITSINYYYNYLVKITSFYSFSLLNYKENYVIYFVEN